jgi:peptidyl-prolyl cis-trans isomerase D
MLTTIREKTQGIIATIIIAFIAIPFALWGINSYFDGGSRLDVASVNGEKISEAVYRGRLEELRRDPRLADSPAIKRQILDSIVDEMLIVRDAHNQGFRLGDERLARIIRENPQFQNAGRYEPELYENFVRRQGMTKAGFENQQRLFLVTSQLHQGLVNSSIVTDAELAGLLRLLKQQREIAYLTIGAERFLAGASVTPAAVEEYYHTHPELFRTEEQVRIEYVRLAAPDLLKDLRASEAELRKLYADDPSKSLRPESRRAAHILIALAPSASAGEETQALAKIEGIEKQLRAGADFAKLARAHSQDTDSAAQGGDLGELRPGVLPKSLQDAIFALKAGELSKPVRSEYGYHLTKLTAYQPAVQRPFEELRPQLEKQWRQQQGETRYFEASEKLRNLVFEQSDSLAPAADALGLKVATSEWFGRAGGSGVAAHPRVIEAAFGTEAIQQKRNSDAIELAGDTLAAIRVVDHRPAVPKPLNDVRAQIERKLRQEAAQRAARELGEKLVQELGGGQSLEATARKLGLAVQGPKLVARDATGVDRAVVDAAFRAARPAGGKPVSGGVDLGSKGFAVYVLSRVIDGDVAKADAATREKAKRMLATQRGAGIFLSYRDALKQKADIKIYPERL